MGMEDTAPTTSTEIVLVTPADLQQVTAGHSLEAILGAWQLSLRSENTRTAYSADLVTFLQFAGAHQVAPLGDPRVLRPLIDLWMTEQQADGAAAATRARRLAAVRSFYRYVTIEGYMERDPSAMVRRPHVPNEPSKTALTLGEARAILEATTTGSGSPATRAAVGLLLGAALRVSEAISARVEDISHRDGHTVLSVVGKGERRRVIPLSPLTLEMLGPLPVEGWLVPAPDGGQCNRYQVAHMVRRIAEAAGIDRPVSPHILRHTAATVALDGGAPVQTVADLLGHSSPTTTMRYVAGRERLRDSAAYVVGVALAG
jgi:integrase/recombinase XerD